MPLPYQMYTSAWFRLLVCALVALVVVGLKNLPLLRDFERLLYDLRVRQVAPREAPSPDIVIVGIDDASLVRLEPAVGRWPWPRGIFAGVLEHLAEARVVAMDIIFSEPDWQYGGDDLFAGAVAEHAQVVSAVHFGRQGISLQSLGDSLQPFTVASPLFGRAAPPPARAALVPYKALLDASARIGHVNFRADDDGVVRSYQLVVHTGIRSYPSMALAVAMQYRGLSNRDLRQDEGGRFWVGDTSVALDEGGHFLWCPGSQSYPYYSVADIIDAWKQESEGRTPDIARAAFADKIVLVGSLATGLEGSDRKVTPLASQTPGIVITATALDNLLQGRSFRRLGGVAALGLVLLMSMLPGTLLVERPLTLALGVVLAALAYVLVGFLFLTTLRLVLPMSLPLLGLLLSGAAAETFYWAAERSQRRHLEAMEAAKQQFTDMLVHDMKGRTASISMSVDLLERQAATEQPKARKLLTALRTSSNHLLAQMSALLDIRKMQEGRLQLEPAQVELPELLQALVDEYQPSAELVGVGLELVAGPAGGAAARLDAKIFSRIMENLVWNAVQHAERGSKVQVGFDAAADGSVEVHVTNHGPAIPRTDQEAVFSPFVSGGRGWSHAKAPSTGLGLSFCKLATEAHGGTIRMVSPFFEAREGVRIIVSLPAPPAVQA